MESRVRFLEQTLATMGFSDTLRAMDWMISEMNAEKGYSRHDGSHYYYHLVDATIDAITLNRGLIEQDTATIIMLHDSKEDIPGVTSRMIENMFNTRVAVGVDLLTKDPNVDYKVEPNNVAYYNAILRNRDSAIGKTADVKHNFSTLLHASMEKRLRKAFEVESVAIPFMKQCRKLYPRFAHYFFAAKTAIEPHLWAIKEYHAEIEELQKQIMINHATEVADEEYNNKYRI